SSKVGGIAIDIANFISQLKINIFRIKKIGERTTGIEPFPGFVFLLVHIKLFPVFYTVIVLFYVSFLLLVRSRNVVIDFLEKFASKIQMMVYAVRSKDFIGCCRVGGLGRRIIVHTYYGVVPFYAFIKVFKSVKSLKIIGIVA